MNEVQNTVCRFCGKPMSLVRKEKITAWRNQTGTNPGEASLYWCDKCKIHCWTKHDN